MSKSKSNGIETYDENVVRVSKPTELPYSYIPYYSVSNARVNHPDDKLYVYEPGVPVGYRIVAFPIQMEKPKEEETDGTDGE